MSKPMIATLCVISGLAGALGGAKLAQHYLVPQRGSYVDVNMDGMRDIRFENLRGVEKILYGQPDGTLARTEPTIAQLRELEENKE